MLPGLSSADEIKARVLFFLSAAIDRSACPRPISRLRAMSGVRESNPPPRLGKPMHYRCANTARCFRYFPKNGAKILLFFDIRKSLIIFYVFLEKNTYIYLHISSPSRYFSPAFLHTSSIARHGMPFVTFGGIFQCSFSRILSGRLRLFRPNLIWTRLCHPFFVICPDI